MELNILNVQVVSNIWDVRIFIWSCLLCINKRRVTFHFHIYFSSWHGLNSEVCESAYLPLHKVVFSNFRPVARRHSYPFSTFVFGFYQLNTGSLPVSYSLFCSTLLSAHGIWINFNLFEFESRSVFRLSAWLAMVIEDFTFFLFNHMPCQSMNRKSTQNRPKETYYLDDIGKLNSMVVLLFHFRDFSRKPARMKQHCLLYKNYRNTY